MSPRVAPPIHSVAIDAATNRIATAGYQYDVNGNLTQMPLMTMGYDIANRMVTSNHSGAGTQSYGYNHANQRVFVRNGNTGTYYLHGLGGERLMEFQETCTGTACSGYQETQRWICFAGRKMFSKTGSTLKAVTSGRLGSTGHGWWNPKTAAGRQSHWSKDGKWFYEPADRWFYFER
ncbi:MAG: hypothetical protein LC114_18035 [Bryobacterales bacterium]|nr:hypothetical protein [Bryobacterales bacterium]